jgi:hypothetical protein
MKKLFLISVLVCLAGLNQLFAANPIPSYNVLISNGKTSFQESVKQGAGGAAKEKRQMNIETTVSTSPTSGFGRAVAVAYVYQIVGHTTLGPFYIPVGQSIAVGIDETAWGVNIATPDAAFVSVWTTN